MDRFYLILMSAFSAVSLGFGYTTSDVPGGWASMGGGTTGGTGGAVVIVSTMSGLQREAGSVGKKIILVEKGDYSGDLTPASDKSILGIEPGVNLNGIIFISGANNIIIRNLAVRSPKCSGGSCRSGTDAVAIQDGSQHVWLDHLDISDGQDGNCDVKKAADFITITWCKFYYTYKKAHRLSNLIAGSDGESESEGKLNITYAYGWWGDLVNSRMPRGRFGKIHVLNNLYTSQAAGYACGPGKNMQMLIEKNVFKCTGTAVKSMGSNSAWKTVGNIGTTGGLDSDKGTVFTPPYENMPLMDASEVEAAVRERAGNTLTLEKTINSRHIYGEAPLLRPSVAATKSGWKLWNSTSSPLTFTVNTVNGKTVISTTRLGTGEGFHVPRSGPTLYIHFKGAHSSEGIPLLYSN